MILFRSCCINKRRKMSLPEQSVVSSQNLQAKDLSLKSVTVFNDRAEIKREFQVTLKAGLNEVRIEVNEGWVQKFGLIKPIKACNQPKHRFFKC